MEVVSQTQSKNYQFYEMRDERRKCKPIKRYIVQLSICEKFERTAVQKTITNKGSAYSYSI